MKCLEAEDTSLAFLLASPATPKERIAIGKGEAWHFSKASHKQVMTKKLGGAANVENAEVHLSPPTGWQLDFWKFIRDLSVWDPDVISSADRGRYLYLFLGQPGTWTRRINVQKAPLTIRIPGDALLLTVPAANLFYRAADKVIVIRGDYRGPAILEPPPP